MVLVIFVKQRVKTIFICTLYVSCTLNLYSLRDTASQTYRNCRIEAIKFLKRKIANSKVVITPRPIVKAVSNELICFCLIAYRQTNAKPTGIYLKKIDQSSMCGMNRYKKRKLSCNQFPVYSFTYRNNVFLSLHYKISYIFSVSFCNKHT